MIAEYLPILLLLLFAIFLASLLLTISFLLGPKRPKASKLTPYESGINPIGDAREKFSMKYYMIGALFILFDVETVFLFVWAVVFKELGLFAFIEIIVFLFVIICGYLYALRKGVLEWD